MRISVFGLGYVGVVTAACLAQAGHDVIGVDVLATKVDQVKRGRSPIVEPGLADLVRAGVAQGRLRATRDARHATRDSEMAIVCVGTPSDANGGLDTTHVRAVVSEIGSALRKSEQPFLLVMRSTMLPGTMRQLVIPTFEHALGRSVGEGTEVVFHPEFLREGTSVADFNEPPKIVIGERIEGSGARLMALYEHIAAPRMVTSLEVAEAVKYADNCFHAVKVTFANEIGQVCQAHGVDGQAVMDIVCRDTKLNISPRYLKPAFAFGGSCLPKDLRAFLAAAQERKVATPMLRNVLTSNNCQIDRALERILACGQRELGMAGLAFKPGTDDLRESPLVVLAERLLARGMNLRIFDASVEVGRLVGQNEAFVERVFPHLAEVLVARFEDLYDARLMIVGHAQPRERIAAALERGLTVIDLTGARMFEQRATYISII